jgi:hypothetical protein
MIGNEPPASAQSQPFVSAAANGAAASWSARLVDWLDPPGDFNFRHFRPRHMAAELLRTARTDGVLPGSEAPDFDLETTDGGRLRLSELRGQPVLLHFGSYT